MSNMKSRPMRIPRGLKRLDIHNKDRRYWQDVFEMDDEGYAEFAENVEDILRQRWPDADQLDRSDIEHMKQVTAHLRPTVDRSSTHYLVTSSDLNDDLVRLVAFALFLNDQRKEFNNAPGSWPAAHGQMTPTFTAQTRRHQHAGRLTHTQNDTKPYFDQSATLASEVKKNSLLYPGPILGVSSLGFHPVVTIYEIPPFAELTSGVSSDGDQSRQHGPVNEKGMPLSKWAKSNPESDTQISLDRRPKPQSSDKVTSNIAYSTASDLYGALAHIDNAKKRKRDSVK